MIKLIQVQLLWFIVATSNGVFGLNVEFEVPKYVRMGESAVLECSYKVSANETTSLLKFYKNGKEFSRFVPEENNKYGSVDPKIQNVFHKNIQLDHLTFESSGYYRCEVFLESAARRNSPTKYMTVVELPVAGPMVTGEQSQYMVGDVVNINCSSSQSKPAASLKWSINDEQAPDTILLKYPTVIDSDGLETVILGLKFTVKKRHYRNGVFGMTCSSSLGNLSQRSYDLIYLGDGTSGVQSDSVLSATFGKLGKSKTSSLMTLAWFMLSSMNSIMLVV